MKEVIIDILHKTLKKDKESISKVLEVPPKEEMGDFAFPCFILTKDFKKAPIAIAEELVNKLRKKETKEIASIEHNGPYINFFINKNLLAKKIIKEAQKKSWGTQKDIQKQTICIDLSAPNIAKPFGIGHLRSTIIGDSIGRIAEKCGHKVIRINYLGDWGTQFGKLIYAYKTWGNEKKLNEDPIKHLQSLYVKINKDKSYDKNAREEFKKLEEDNKENKELWEKFKTLSLEEFNKIYDMLGVSFQVTSGESKHNTSMKKVIEKLEKKGLIVESDDAKIVDLKKENKGVVLIQKSDGTSLYATRDIAAAIHRMKTYKFDKMLYEVGSEQKLHFEQLFLVLEKMGYRWSKGCQHISHGLYLDTDGKKFSTRKGKTVYLKDILDETISKAKKNLKKRDKNLKKEELEKRAQSVAIAAIKYGDLKNYRENNIIFDIDKFLEFEGDTGPYLLYSYARANSIIEKQKSKKEVKIIDLKNEEISLLKKIALFPEVISQAHEKSTPNTIANYTFELAKSFNEFYHVCPVIGGIEEEFRIEVVKSFRATLHQALEMLGITPLKKM